MCDSRISSDVLQKVTARLMERIVPLGGFR
jgi:hypothetical protein